MFTDMVGYTALMQDDESRARAMRDRLRNTHRTHVPRHGGQILQFYGDGVLCSFASAIEATRCAIELQKALQKQPKVPARFGIHLGDVIFEKDGIVGDGVNVASRIEQVAVPGGICISEKVYDDIKNQSGIQAMSLGQIALKNVRRPIEVFALTGEGLAVPEKGRRVKQEKFEYAKTNNRLLKKGVYKYGGIVVLLILVGVAFYFVSPIGTSSVDRASIAVLPFKNFNDGRQDDYFSDGITEDVIAHLSRIGKLKVISRNSVMPYKNSKKSVRDIGRELNVAALLDGSVRREGSQIRIVAQLINAYNAENIWAQTYDRELTQIFAIQSDVAQKIATALETQISPDEKERLEKRGTESLEAYDSYLKGRYHWNKRIPDELQKGIGYFDQTLDKDSSYALAYAGLADSYTLLGNFNVLAPNVAYPRAKAAATRALEIDNGLAEAHTSFAFATMYYDWDWSSAEREFKRAIELNPSYATARSWYAFFLTVMGRFQQASDVREEAQGLDPLSVVVSADVGLALYFERKYDQAIEQYLKTLEMDPLFVAAYIPLGAAYVQKSMHKEALEVFSKASMYSGGLPIPVAALGYAYAVSGRQEDAIMMLDLLRDRASQEYISPYWTSVIYTGLGDNDKAFEWLERAYEEKDGSMVFVKVEPAFDRLRSDPRFESLVKKMKFEQ